MFDVDHGNSVRPGREHLCWLWARTWGTTGPRQAVILHSSPCCLGIQSHIRAGQCHRFPGDLKIQTFPIFAG